jgi:hypothetical protein
MDKYKRVYGLLEKMHGRARRGATHATMCRSFPDLSPADIEHWLRQNMYIRNGWGRKNEK